MHRPFKLARIDRPRAALFAPLLAASLCTLISCTSVPDREPTLAVASDQYAAAFEHAKRVLLDHGFELDRVDFREGIITTRPKATSGLATPWHADQSSPSDEAADLLNRHRRVVRVSFKPTIAAPATAPNAATPNASNAKASPEASPHTASVEVSILREHRPGRRLEPKAVRFSTVTRDESLVARGLWPRHETPLESDDALARRLSHAMDTQATPSP